MMSHYVLGGPDGHVPIWEPDVLAWAQWFECSLTERVVGQIEIKGWEVSTVFLGVDHNLGNPTAPRQLFETMIFPAGTVNDVYCARYATWRDAEAGHAAVVAAVERGELPAEEA
jgi:hypothetical protein